MLSTLENRSKKNFARAGFLGAGLGLYYAVSAIVVLATVVLGIYALDAYLTWKDEKEV